jgi:quinol monooxygenase YgiN
MPWSGGKGGGRVVGSSGRRGTRRHTVAFIQIVEFDSTRIDEMRERSEQYRQDTEGTRTSSRATVCADRDKPDHYFLIVEFDSYEDAMRNSESPETQKMSKDMAELGSGPPTFHNLDVLDTWGA